MARESWYEAATVNAVGFGFKTGLDICGVGSRRGAKKRQRVVGANIDNPTLVVLSHVHRSTRYGGIAANET